MPENAVSSTWTSGGPEVANWIVAHRGASVRHRESSAEAFEVAIDDGASAVETDVRRTKDGVFVCHHDATLARTAGMDRVVADLTLSEFRELAPDYAVRLEDVLGLVRRRCNVLLDLKLNDDADVTALVKLLEKLKIDDTIAIGVRSLETQARLRALAPQFVQLGLLPTPDDAPAFVAAGGSWVRLWEQDATADRIRQTRSLGVPVLVMVGGPGTDRPIGQVSPERLAELAQHGANGFMLDDPRIASEIPG